MPAHSHLVATTRAKRLWTFVALAAVGVALVYAGISSYVRVTGKGTDFNVFYLAARTLAERPADLYHFRAPRGPTYTYIYPPTFAVLMRPVAALPLGASAITWSLLNIAFFLHGAWVLARALAPPPRRFDFLAWILVLGTPFAVENIFLGQVHGLIAYLMIRGVDRLRSGRSGAGAIWLAAAAAVKLIPAVFGLYFLVRRDWRGLASFALAGAVLTALPPAVVLGPRTAGALLGEFADMLVLPYVTAGASSHAIYDRTAARKTLHDQDFGALLTRLAGQDQDAARRALVVLSALLLAVSAAATWRRSPGARAPGEVEVACGIFTVLSLLLSPRNRLAYWTVLIIPWSVLVARLVGPPRHGAIRPIAAATLVVSASLLAIADPPVPTVQAMTLGFWGLSALWLGLIALAGLERGEPRRAAASEPGG